MFFKDTNISKHTLRGLRHDHLLNFSEESLFEGTDRTNSKVYVELPHPIHIPLQTSHDSVTRLIEDKKKYNNLQESVRNRFLRYDQNKIDENELKGKSIRLPKYLVKWYNKEDPDPQFNQDYNYYYTGGNLEYFQYDNRDYFVRPSVENELLITNINNDYLIDFEVIRTGFLAESVIYNINKTYLNNNLYFIIREKQRITGVTLDDDFNFEVVYSQKFEKNVLDAKLFKDDLFGYITQDSNLVINNIETNQLVSIIYNNLSEEIDSFQQFRFLDKNSVIIMNRKNITIYDKRTKFNEIKFEPELLNCNGFCNFVTIDNSLIGATRHYLLKTDLRYCKNHFHYSHSLSEAPCYMDYVKQNLDTYLSVSGQTNNSKVLFTGHSIFSMPFKIPSVDQTITESKKIYDELLLKHNLEKRLSYSVTGLKLLNLKGTINIFSSNCFGEIFKQQVFENEPFNDNPTEAIYLWTTHLGNSENALYSTHVEDLSDIFDSLIKNNEENVKVKMEQNSSKEKDFLKKFKKKYSSNNVTSQTAKDFLEIWEDSDESEDEDNEDSEEDTLEKVNKWLHTQNFNPESMDDSIN